MRFVTCLGPDGVDEPAVLSADGTAVTPLRWLGLPCDTLTEAIPQLTPAVRAGLALALSAIPSVPLDAVQLQSPIPCPAQDVVCLGINYMAHSDEAEKYSADAFATQHQDAIYFSKAGAKPSLATTELATYWCCWIMPCITSSSFSADVKLLCHLISLPSRSTKIVSGPFTIISVTVSSSTSSCKTSSLRTE